MVTSGQACCMILDMEITPENRQIAKRLVEESLFGVTFLALTTEPIAIAKTLIAKNPFKYKSYPDTPPGSPKIKAIDWTDMEKSPKESSEATDTINFVTKPNGAVYSRKDIIAIAKIAFSLRPDKDIGFYRYTFITTKDMYKIMRKLMPNLENSLSERSFAHTLGSRDHYFGTSCPQKGGRGRYLYVLKDECIDFFIQKDKRGQE